MELINFGSGHQFVVNGGRKEAVNVDFIKDKGAGHRLSIAALDWNTDCSDTRERKDDQRPATADPNHSSDLNLEKFRFLFVPFLKSKNIRTSKHNYFRVITTLLISYFESDTLPQAVLTTV